MEASDPYCFAAYDNRMGRPAHKWSFQDGAEGVLDDLEPYDIVLSSFALHLVEPQWQYITFSALARSTRFLVVLTPHKRPIIDSSTGFAEVGEIVHERVRVRLYESQFAHWRNSG
jgi:hypothetical protein